MVYIILRSIDIEYILPVYLTCRAYWYYMTFSIRATAPCCCAALKILQKSPKTKPRRKAPRLTDERCARSSFGTATTYSLPSFLLRGLG